MVKRMNLFVLAMLITGAIDSIRNLPATALFGTQLVFFCIFAAIVFLIPVALLSADLSSRLPDHGGVYRWTRLAFGENVGFLAVWLQWVNTMIWCPTILSFIAGTFAYLIDPALLANKAYLVSVILVVFWALTLLNLRGVHVSSRFAAFCAMVGMVIPMAVIILLGISWVISGHKLAISLNIDAALPSLLHPDSWVSLTAIMASFLGMELAAVHVKDVEKPQRTFPRALLLSVAIILITMIFGALSIAVVLPEGQMSLVGGVVQAMSEFFAAYHMKWCLPVLVILIIVGSIGSMINWVISPAKGLLQAGQHGFLPPWMTHVNRHGVASHILILQAVLVSLVCFAFMWLPSVNGSYWFLTALSTELYLLMYIIMFFAGLRLYKKFKHLPSEFVIPGGEKVMRLIVILGVFGCVLALMIGLIPPSTIDVGNKAHYDLVFVLGILALVSPVVFFAHYRRQHKKNTSDERLF